MQHAPGHRAARLVVPLRGSGHDDGAARTHAAECRPTNPGVGILPRHHFS
ncbi:hypothetical protein LUX09_05250 [Streptomyces albogriseolus]|nr:hypothetical protein [Streptomyces albogriseolus]